MHPVHHCLSPQLLPGFLGHRDTFPRSKAFEQPLLKALLLQALDVLTDEPPDIVAWRAVMGSEAALFDELFEVFREGDGQSTCLARHQNKKNEELLLLIPTLSKCKLRKIIYLPLTTLPQDEAHFRGGSWMGMVRIELLDHLGLIAAVIND